MGPHPQGQPAMEHVVACVKAKSHSHVCLCVTPWAVAHQAPLSEGLSRQEYWSGRHAPFQGIFSPQRANPCLLCLLHWRAGSSPLVRLGSPVAAWRAFIENKTTYKWTLASQTCSVYLSVVVQLLSSVRLQHARLPCPSPSPRVSQTHVHRVGDAAQSSHPLSPSYPHVLNLSQHQGLFR